MPKTNSTVILGIDPGVSRTGYGIVVTRKGDVEYKTAGLIETRAGTAHTERLRTIHRAIRTLLARYRPQRVGVEKLYFTNNAKTAFSVGEARGVVLLAIGERKLPLMEFTPPQVKQAVTGYGKADKRQVQSMVAKLLNLKSVPTPDDVADALAVAICTSHSNQTFTNHS